MLMNVSVNDDDGDISTYSFNILDHLVKYRLQSSAYKFT
jgi:hypothetical protein